MTGKSVRVLWWISAFVSLGIFIASIPGYFMQYHNREILSLSNPLVQILNLLSMLTSIFVALTCLTLAWIIFWRKSEDRMALYSSFFLLVYGILLAGPIEFLEKSIPFLKGMSPYIQSYLLPVPLVIFFYLFPDGQLVPRWTRWHPLALILWLPSLYLLAIPAAEVRHNPTIVIMIVVWFFSVPLTGVYTQFYRYRHVSSPFERQQTKWVVFGMTLWMLVGATFFILPYLSISIYGPLSGVLWFLSLAIFPITLAISILRAKLWDIDILIRRTLQYGILTGLLALIYYGLVIILQNLFASISNQQSPIFIVISTLAIAALFNPLRYRIQDFIDRRFYRRKYDAEQALAKFAAAARDEVDMEKLADALLGVVEETMQPDHVSLWLVPSDKRRNTA